MSDLSKPYILMALNNAWANATFFTALAPLDDAAFAAPRPGFFASLMATMNHIWLVDRYYIDALEQAGLGRTVRDLPQVTRVVELAALQATTDLRLIAFCRRLDAATLAETRLTERAEGPIRETVDHLLLHLFQHQVHHRGQAHVQLQDAGIAPPQLDEFYLDYDRAPTAQAYFS